MYTFHHLSKAAAAAFVFTSAAYAQEWTATGSVTEQVSSAYMLSTALSADGTVWASGNSADGTVIVRRRNGSTWEQMGSAISNSQHFGYAVDLDTDGDVLIVSDRDYNSPEGVNGGRVSVYAFDGSDWQPKGSPIDGTPSYYQPGGGTEGFADQLGTDVGIDAAGNTIAISSPQINGVGQARVYTFSNGDWVLKGEPLQPSGNVIQGKYANAISLTPDGNCLAIGSLNDGQSEPGMVEVFRFDGTAWVLHGVPVHGSDADDLFGQSVALSDDGESFVVAAPYESPYEGPGYAQVYRYLNGFWVPKGQRIDTWPVSAGYDLNVSISGNGNVVALNCMLYGIVRLSTTIIR